MQRRGFHQGDLAPAVVLAGVILAVFGATLGFGLLSWDDDRHLTANPWLTGADWPRFWTGRYLGLYVPVVYTLWTGLRLVSTAPDPRVFHGANILMHALNAVLVYRLLAALMRRSPTTPGSPYSRLPALGGALVFALHPLQVETVAWASGFRDLTSTAFALAAMLSYGSGMTGVGVVAFVASLLCKPAVAALPVALAGAIWVYEGGGSPLRALKQAWRLGLWLIPAVVVAVATWLIQGPVLDSDVGTVPVLHRLVVGADALGFYLEKLIAPVQLAVDYGRSPANLMAGRAYLTTGTLAVACLVLAVVLRRQLGRPLLAGLVFAALVLAPVLGFVPFAFQHISTVADHYAYLPVVGVALAVAAVLARLPRRTGAAVTVALALVLGCLSWRRLPVWKDDATFFAAMLASNPTSISARIGLGGVATATQDFEGALVEFDAALALEPHNVTVVANRGLALAHLRRYAEVLAFVPPRFPVTAAEIHRTPQTEDSYTAMYLAVGYAYLGLGHPAEAVVALCRAGELAPRHKDVATFLPVAREQLRQAGAPEAAGVCH